MLPLKEYLYIDQRRLDAYFEQISESSVKYDKIPTWKAGIGITSLGAEGSENLVARPFTTHEKIAKVLEYLRKGTFLGEFSNSGLEQYSSELKKTHDPNIPFFDELKEKKFHLFTGQATKIKFPVDGAVPITFWIYLNDLVNFWSWLSVDEYVFLPEMVRANIEFLIFLTEAAPGEDPPAISRIHYFFGEVYSGGSTLGNMLIHALAESMDAASEVALNSKFIHDVGIQLPLLFEDVRDRAIKKQRSDDFRYEDRLRQKDVFLNVLTELGASVAAEQTIQTLYRVKMVARKPKVRGLFGYPIFIAEAD